MPIKTILGINGGLSVAKSGDLGYTSGRYKFSFKDPSGKPATDNGKYLTVWNKQADGS